MPTLTVIYATPAERLSYERAIAFVAEMYQLGLAAPDGTVIDACEALALSTGRDLFRDTLAAAVQGGSKGSIKSRRPLRPPDAGQGEEAAIGPDGRRQNRGPADVPDLSGVRAFGEQAISLRQAEATPPALLPNLPLSLLRAKRHSSVRLPTAPGQGRLLAPPSGRTQWRPRHRTTRRGESQYRGPLQSPGRRPRSPDPRRTRGFFPRRPARSSSMRSGRSSSRGRSTATPTTRPMTIAAIGGTTWPSTPSTDWVSASPPDRGP